jgi:hypothetical protein
MVFDGEELLPFAVKNIRPLVDHIAVTYQTTSYFGNPCNNELLPTIQSLLDDKLIDQAIHYEPNLSLPPKDNELKLRNIGLNSSRQNNCTHHISFDVDEFCTTTQLQYAKQIVEQENPDFTMTPHIVYFKHPTYQITPHMNLNCTFIHPVDNDYIYNNNFPFKIDITRRFRNYNNYRVFSLDEVAIHHMSYVRKDIKKKFMNSDNGRCYQLKKFLKQYNEYQLGDKICLLPDWLARRTQEVENIFKIHLAS